MGKIAAAAGLTPNTLHWYFGDKHELFVAAADRYLDQRNNELAAATISSRLAWQDESS